MRRIGRIRLPRSGAPPCQTVVFPPFVTSPSQVNPPPSARVRSEEIIKKKERGQFSVNYLVTLPKKSSVKYNG